MLAALNQILRCFYSRFRKVMEPCQRISCNHLLSDSYLFTVIVSSYSTPLISAVYEGSLNKTSVKNPLEKLTVTHLVKKSLACHVDTKVLYTVDRISPLVKMRHYKLAQTNKDNFNVISCLYIVTQVDCSTQIFLSKILINLLTLHVCCLPRPSLSP